MRARTAWAREHVPDPNAPMVYGGPPRTQFITIEPAQPDVVYVPSYNPERIYGEPVAAYPGYVLFAAASRGAGLQHCTGRDGRCLDLWRGRIVGSAPCNDMIGAGIRGA